MGGLEAYTLNSFPAILFSFLGLRWSLFCIFKFQ
jgi:hypothetical protein